MPKVSEEHRAARREEILCAARRRFAREGFHATSMQDILAESGLSAGAVYGYFDGKSDIIAAIAHDHLQALAASLAQFAADPEHTTVADVVVEIVRTIRERQRSADMSHVALQVWAEAAREPSLATGFTSASEQLRAVVARLVAVRHPDRADDADTIAGAVTAMVPGFILQLSLTPPARAAHFEDGVRAVLGEL